MALISFDNAVEAAVVTYLGLNPNQRSGREFQKDKVIYWMNSFLTKLEFLETFAGLIDQPMAVQRDEMTYIHKLRNDLYHAGNNLVPSTDDIVTAREGAIWTISTLFSIDARGQLEADEADEDMPPPQVSADTELLEQLIELRKRVDTLSGSLERPNNGAGSIAERIEELDADGALDAAGVRQDLAEAEQIKDRILNGQPVEQSDDRLRELVARIGPLTEHIGRHLAAHQRSLAEAAYRATLPLSATGGVAGLVHQSAGTGMSMSTLAYLALCRDSDDLKGHAQLVLFDRRDSVEQFEFRIRDAFKDLSRVSVSAPSSTQALAAALSDTNGAIVLATMAQARALAGKSWSSKRLVVCSQLAIGPGSLAELEDLFPNAIFIAFASMLPRGGADAFDQWKSLIATYRWLEAIQDGLITPPVVVDRSDVLPPPDDSGHPLMEMLLQEVQADAIAKAIAEDFRRRARSPEDARAVVLVSNIVSGERLTQLLRALLSDVEVVQCAPSRDGARASMRLNEFIHSAGPTILVATVAAMSGLYLNRSAALYVACQVAESATELVLSMAARIGSTSAEPAVIVDFASNTWQRH